MAAGEDRFDYTIEIRDKFSDAVELFRAKLAEAKAGIASFQSDIKGLGGGSKDAAASLASANKELKASADATEGVAVSSKKAKQELTQLERVELSLAKAIQKKSDAALKDQLVEERGIEALKKKTRDTTEFTRAVNEVEGALARQRIAALKQEIIDEAGITTLNKKAAAAERVAAAFNAETEATKRATRADEEAARTQALAVRGRDAQGRPQFVGPPLAPPAEIQGPPEPDFNAVTRAEQIAELAQQRLATETELNRQGLDARGRQITALTREEQLQQDVNSVIERRIALEARETELSARGRDAQGRLQFVGPPAPEPGQPRALTLDEQARARVATTLQRLELKKLEQQLTKTNPRIKELKEELGETNSVGNRISFTFRRLIGIFAAFTAVRLFVGQLKEGVANSIRFNQEIENATLGIASLIIATGKMEDATGKNVDAQQSWALALKESRRQIQLLRIDNLRTAATLPQLTKAFQTATGIGLTNGLNIDEIRRFTVMISQAAAAIDLPQEQLPEEIRSLLQGTIQARTTRIATTLGITNEDIRKAKEMGTLFEFLENRFAAFNKAADEGLKTFSVRLSNAKDAIVSLLGAGLEGFFTKLSDLLDFIQKQVVSISDTGIQINPSALAAVRVLGDILTAAVDEAKQLMQSLSAGDVKATFTNISITLQGAISAVGILVDGVLKGLSLVARPLSVILQVVQQITGVFSPVIRFILTWSIAILAAWKSAQVIWFTIPQQALLLLQRLIGAEITTVAMKNQLAGMAVYLSVIQSEWKVIAASIGIVAALLTAIFSFTSGIKTKLEEMSGVTGTWGDTINAIFFELGGIIEVVFKGIVDGFTDTINQVELIFISLFKFILDGFATVVSGALDKLSGLVPGVSKIAAEIKAGIAGAQQSLNALAGDKASKITAGGGFWQRQIDALKEVNDKTAAYFKSLSDEENGVKNIKLSQNIEDMPGIVGNTTKEVDALSQAMQKLHDEIESAEEALQITRATLGAQNTVQQQGKIIAQEKAKLDKESRNVTSEMAQATSDMARAKGEQLSIEAKIARLQRNQRDEVANAVAATQQILDLKRQIATQETKVELDKLSLGRAVEAGVGVPQAQATLSASSQELDRLQNSLKVSKGLADSVFSDVAEADAKKLTVLALSLVSAKGKQVDAQRRVNEATKAQATLEDEVNKLAGLRVAAIAVEETSQSRRRLAEISQQVAAAERLSKVKFSRSEEDHSLAAAQNELALAQSKLDTLREDNRLQEQGLKNILANTTNFTAQVALKAQLFFLTKENAKQETLGSQAVQDASDAIKVLRTAQADAFRQSSVASRNQVRDLEAQTRGQERLLRARGTVSELDDRFAQARNEQDAQEAKIAGLKAELKLRGNLKREELAAAVDPEVRKRIEAELVQLRAAGKAELAGQVAALLLIKSNTSKILRDEIVLALTRSGENIKSATATRADTRARAIAFDTSLGTSTQAEELAAATSSVIIEQDKLNILAIQLHSKEEAKKLDIAETSNLAIKGAKYLELVALQADDTAQLNAQLETLYEQNRILDKIRAKIEHPVHEGLLEGIRQFIREAPTMFNLSVDVMKNSLKGLAKVGADSLTGIFDRENTTSVKQRFGRLGLDIGNQIFEGLLQRLLAQSLGKLFFDDSILVTSSTTAAGIIAAGGEAAGAAILAGASAGAATLGFSAAVSETTALAFIGAAHGGLWTAPGVPPARFFGEGGTGSRRRKDARDTIPGWFRPGEYTLTPEAVQHWGLSAVNDLNNLVTPRGLSDVARPVTARESSKPAQSSSQQRREKSELRVLPVMLTDRQAMARLLAGGDQEMQAWMASNGYRPSF